MVTKGADQVGDSVAMLDKIETGLRSLYAHKAELDSKHDELERLGWVEAKPHYRDGKYLYLIYPMHDGERKREYIGGDPEKILEALAKIQRKDEIDAVERQQGDVSFAIHKVQQLLIQAMGECYKVKW